MENNLFKKLALAGALTASALNPGKAMADDKQPSITNIENKEGNKASLSKDQLKHDLANVENPEKIIYPKNYSDKEKIFILSELNPEYQKLLTWRTIADRDDIPQEIRKSADSNYDSHIGPYEEAVRSVKAGTYIVPK